MQPTISNNAQPKTYNTTHAFAPGQSVIAGGRLATVKRVYPTGAVEVTVTRGGTLTFLFNVLPVGELVAQ